MAHPYLIYQLQSPVAVMGWRPLPRIDSHLISLWHSAESTYDTFCNTQGPVELSFEKIKEVEVPSYEMLSAIGRGDEWRPRVLQVGRRLEPGPLPQHLPD